MLISRNIRKKLTVLAVGTGLFAGCSSGPQLSSVRFWPGSDKLESAADDEAVAQKWHDRLNASALSNGFGAAPEFETAKSQAEATKPRSSRFNLFRRFSRNEEPEAPQPQETAQVNPTPNPNNDLQRQLLERRIAELEAEQRALRQKPVTPGIPQTASAAPGRESEINDPFLAASQKKQIVRPATRPAPQGANAESVLPSWAQAAADQNPAAPATREVAGEPGTNAFKPSFDQSLNNLEASVGQQPNSGVPQGKAPAMPFSEQPVVTPQKITAPVRPSTPNSFAAAATSLAPRVPAASQSRTDGAVTEPGKVQDQLSSLRSAEEQQQAWAHLEVQQLMKRSRILARAGELSEALTTALSAEQLANSAGIKFSDREQTPAQLVSLIRLKAEETSTALARTEPAQTEPRTPQTNPNVQPVTPPNFVSQNVSTKAVAPPQWPGRDSAIKPRQVSNDHPLVSTPAGRQTTKEVQNLQTAEFIHPRPAQSVQPHATTSDQWYSQDDHPMAQSSRDGGSYIESPTAPRRSRNEINAQFVSATTIYSPENLQWTKLDDSQATIPVEHRVPAPPSPVAQPGVDGQRPPFAQDHQSPHGDDPFAAAFGQENISDTLLTSDDPLGTIAPAIPTSDATEETKKELHIIGIPLRKLGLVGLAGLILMAAIIHRRRTSEIHEL